MKFQVAITNIPSANTNSLLSFNMPGGIRLHGFNLYLLSSNVRTAVNTTNLQRIRITVDTVNLIDWDWPSCLLYALRRGISLSVGQIPIYFTDPLLVGLRNAYAGSIDMKQGIGNIQVQLQLGTITAPSITGELIYDSFPNLMPQKTATGRTMVPFNTPLQKVTTTEVVPTAQGYTFQTIQSKWPLDTITIYDPALSASAISSITWIYLALNKVPIFQGAPLDLADEFKAYGIKTPAGAIVLPFTYDRFSPVSAAEFNSIDLTVNCSAGQPFGVSIESQMPSIT